MTLQGKISIIGLEIYIIHYRFPTSSVYCFFCSLIKLALTVYIGKIEMGISMFLLGRYQSISFDEKNIFEVHKALQSVLILCGDFDNVFRFINEGNNFIYIDPPYRPVGKNMNMFTQYDRSGFKDNDQQRLKDLCNIFGQKGCKIMISNSDSFIDDETSYFEQLYEGYLIDRIQVTRTINTYNAKELRPKEVIITNYETPIIHQPKLF